MVEYLKVLSLSVEPAYASYGRAPPVLSLWSSASGPLPMVEPAYASLTVEPAYASLTVEPAYASLSVESLTYLGMVVVSYI